MFRSRKPIWRCSTPDELEKDGSLAQSVGARDEKGRPQKTWLYYRQLGGPTICSFEAVDSRRKNGPRSRVPEWQARLATTLLAITEIPRYANIVELYPAAHVTREFHAHFVETIPRKIARQVCPELFADQPVDRVAKEEL